MNARVRLNAFCRDSSGSHSITIEATSLDDFKSQEKAFETSVPFRRFYFDHEVQEGDDELVASITEYCE
jgi:hypothetical protein